MACRTLPWRQGTLYEFREDAGRQGQPEGEETEKANRRNSWCRGRIETGNYDQVYRCKPFLVLNAQKNSLLCGNFWGDRFKTGRSRIGRNPHPSPDAVIYILSSSGAPNEILGLLWASPTNIPDSDPQITLVSNQCGHIVFTTRRIRHGSKIPDHELKDEEIKYTVIQTVVRTELIVIATEDWQENGTKENRNQWRENWKSMKIKLRPTKLNVIVTIVY